MKSYISEVTAIKFTQLSAELISFCGGRRIDIIKGGYPDAVAVAYITSLLNKTTFKEITAKEGDYITKDSNGYLSVVKAQYFDSLYTEK